jgi:tetratricopeptide (TPR) repeat protein
MVKVQEFAMKYKFALLALWVATLVSSAVLAKDQVRRIKGDKTTAINCTVKDMSPSEVTIEGDAGTLEKIPVTEIDAIRFDGEPAQFNLVRNGAANGNYESALTALTRVEATPGLLDRAEFKADIEFYKAFCKAKLALAGGGDLPEAGRLMLNFVRAHPKSYHALAANEVVGDLLVQNQNYAQAQEYYAKLADVPFPEYKMKSGVLVGRALVAQKKYPEAEKAFDGVLAIPAAAGTESQRLAATLGKATCLAETNKPDEAVKLVDEVIAKAGPEDTDLLARSYNTLGNCLQKKPGGEKDALLAFLHVDVLYVGNAQAHAEALFNLAKLWNQVNKPERATQAVQTLKDRYPNSAWAKQ